MVQLFDCLLVAGEVLLLLSDSVLQFVKLLILFIARVPKFILLLNHCITSLGVGNDNAL
jgi:hypothetical protein